jgi:hypothetical protein
MRLPSGDHTAPAIPIRELARFAAVHVGNVTPP